MAAPTVSDDQFIRIWKSYASPTRVAEHLGVSHRSVYERRKSIERRTGILLPAATRIGANAGDSGAGARMVMSARRDVNRLEIDNGVVLVGSDAHYTPGLIPTAHKALCNLACDLGSGLTAVILNGDILDGGTISRHPRGGWTGLPNVKQELEAVQERVADIESAVAPGVRLMRTYGNHCFDQATECLTQRGWLPYDQIRKDDLVLSLDGDTAVWSPIEEIIKYEHSGEMVRIEKTRMSMSVTPKHRVLLNRLNWKTAQYDIREYRAADDLPSSFNIPVAGTVDQQDAPIADDMLSLIGWILTDGAMEPWGISIYQSKPERRAEIEALLRRAGIPFTMSERQRNHTEVCGRTLVKPSMLCAQYRIPAEPTKEIRGKFLPVKGMLPPWALDLSARQFKVLLDALVAGDGTWTKAGTCCVLYGTKDFLSSVQEAAPRYGWGARLTTDSRGHWRLWMTSEPKIRIEKRDVFREHYAGWVWCLRVPLTNFMVRRNGVAYFSGNCARFEARLAAQVPEYEGVAGFTLREHLPAWTDSLRIDINEDTVVIHDWHSGIHSGWNDVLKGGCSVVTGHTHELGFKAHKGFKDRIHFGVKTGMLAEDDQPQFDYRKGKPGMNWRSGFSVLTWVDGILIQPEFCAVEADGCAYFRGKRYA